MRWVIVLLAWVAGPLPATPASYPLNVEAQALDAALNAVAEQTGLQLVLYSEVGGSLAAPRLVGRFTRDEALTRLLRGTGLRYEYLDPQTVAILRDVSPAAAPVPQAPAPVTEVIVRSDYPTQTATKMDVPVLEVPQNIQVLSGRLLEDIGAQLLDDALRHVAGVMPGGYYNGWDFFRIRGFDAASSGSGTFLDGLRIGTGVQTNAELFGLERLEVLKGPSSTLYGNGLLGGMINLVSKRPRRLAETEVEISVGSDRFAEVNLDATGGLRGRSDLYGRLVAVYRNGGSFVDAADGISRLYVAPSLTWEAGEDTRLTLLATYLHNVNEIGFPLPARGTVLPNPNGRIPLSRFIGDPRDPGALIDRNASLGYEITHRFGETVGVRQIVRVTRMDTEWDRLIYPLRLGSDLRTLDRWAYFVAGGREIQAADTGVDVRLRTRGLVHHMTAGIDYRRVRYDDVSGSVFEGIVPLDLFDPSPDAVRIPPHGEQPYASRDDSVGFYLQNRVDVTDRLIVSFGARWERGESGFFSGASRVPRAALSSGHAFAPNLGVNFEIVPALHAYASYSESFDAQFDSRVFDPGDPAGGVAADPERGRQYELGLKAGLLDRRLNATVAAYDLTRSNVIEVDPLRPGFVSLTGEQRSRGFELDAQLMLASGWELLIAGAYADSEVVRQADVPAGSALLNAPRSSASLWSKYTFQGGPLRGLGLSIGGSTYGRQAGKSIELPAQMASFDLPGYSLLNVAASYGRGRARWQLNLINLLDEEYYLGSYNELYVLPGNPRSVRLTAGWTF